jgi:proteasome maturation protein
MHIIPPTQHSKSAAQPLPAPSAPGVHDTLRANLALSVPSDPTATSATIAAGDQKTPLQSTHPLEARLRAWNDNAAHLRMATWRHTAGLAGPVWRGIEVQTAKIGEWRPAMLGGGTPVHSDILQGKDWECAWEDVFDAGEEFREVPDFHAEMEARMRMNW